MNDVATIWLTGLSAAGKTTLSEKLYHDLSECGVPNLELLDGDRTRQRMSRKYGYTTEERSAAFDELIGIIQDLRTEGKTTIVATICHKRAMRDRAREILSPYLEVYVSCSVDVCRDRDFKGIYDRATGPEQETVIGVNEPFEPPEGTALVIDTEALSKAEASETLLHASLAFLKESGVFVSA